MSYCIITKATIASLDQIYDIGHEYRYEIGIQLNEYFSPISSFGECYLFFSLLDE